VATGNWTFSTQNWDLDPSQYVSPPKSLRHTADARTTVISDFDGTFCLPQGGIISWLRRSKFGTGDLRLGLCFRNQSQAFQSSWLNGYRIRFDDSPTILLLRCVDGVITVLGTWSDPFPINTWRRYRLTWWNGYNPDAQIALVVRLQPWDGEAWLPGSLLYDTLNNWADSTINRVGLYMGIKYCWADDTQILAPALS